MDHLHAMKRQEVQKGDEDAGPFDFRSILKKSTFAPTESLRRRKGSGSRPIPRIVKSPATEDEGFLPNVIFNDESAIEL